MDSQNKSSSQAPATIDSEEARRRFLASMGIMDPVSPSAESVPDTGESEKDEPENELALSSQPDDLELPGVSSGAPSRSRVVSYEVKPKIVTRSSSQPTEDPVKGEDQVVEPEPAESSDSVSEELGSAPAQETSSAEAVGKEVSETDAKAEDETSAMNHSSGPIEGPLQLSCPKCRGELVLMPEHIGVEGACVWCDTRIVAARSGSDGEVRVFPLFQPVPVEAPVAQVPAASPAESADVEDRVEADETDQSSIDEMITVEKMDPAPAALEDEPTAESSEDVPETNESSPAAAAWSGGFDSPPAAPREASAAGPEAADSVSAGFGDAASELAESAEDDQVENSTAVPAMPADEAPSGFESPSPFSGDVTPARTPEAEEKPVAEASTPEMAELRGGFGEPAGFSDVVAGADPSSDSADEAPAAPEAPEMPNGFGQANDFSAAPEPKATTADETPMPETPAGFANGFSADPFSTALTSSEEESDSAPASDFVADSAGSWGAAENEAGATPAGFSDSPFSGDAQAVEPAGASPGKPEPAAAPAGFAEPAPWGPPAVKEENDSPVSGSPADEAPKPVEEPASPASIASGFEASAPAPTASATADDSSSWADSDRAPGSWGGPDAAPKNLEEPAAAPQAAPAEDVPSGFGSGFAIPASDQSSFPAGASGTMDIDDGNSIFGDASAPAETSHDAASGAATVESWGAPTATNSPEPSASSGEPVPETPGGDHATVEADDEPLESAGDIFAAAEQPAAGGPSLFGAPAASETAPPPIPGAAAPAAGVGETKKGNGLFGASPTVTSQPLGSKPAKKKGKGMVVMLVILLGLVCGAALASFVLPVDEYVEKARAFVEQKLSMESDVDPALFLSEMVTPGEGTAFIEMESQPGIAIPGASGSASSEAAPPLVPSQGAAPTAPAPATNSNSTAPQTAVAP